MLTYKIAFASLKGMCPDLAQKILEIIPSEKEFFSLTEKELANELGTKHKILDGQYRNSILEKAKKESEFINKNNISVIYFNDSNFPFRLLSAADSPIILYTKGDCNLNTTKTVSIVGTRNASQYGRLVCEKIIKDFSDKLDDIIIISGLAYGIDICAHNTAISCDIPTIAVLAHGLNTIYPAAHRNKAVDIIKHGGMAVTDYTSQDIIMKSNFLARNRIVAGLSDCVLVVESAIKGGAMVTAAIAESYNRDIFAVPGRTTDIYSAGCNKLINKNSALLVTSADDIISAMRWETKSSPACRERSLFVDITEEEQPVVDFITANNEIHINNLCSSLNYPMSQLLSILVELEFKGIIMSLPGSKYMIAR